MASSAILNSAFAPRPLPSTTSIAAENGGASTSVASTAPSRMSSSGHNLAIAKASLSASLLRADPTSVNGDEITRFHSLIDKCVGYCSPETVKACKDWVLRNIIASNSRIAAFGKYLVALASSFSPQAHGGSGKVTKPSGRRRRLHSLYIINDILHHTKQSSDDPSISFAATFQEFVPRLLWIAVDQGAEKQRDRVSNLLDIWDAKEYYPREYLKEQRNKVLEAFASKNPAAAADERQEKSQSAAAGSVALKDQNLSFPPMHGSPTMPYYDLPVATMLPHLRPNSPTPINPRTVKPLPMTPGPPRKVLADAVESFLKTVDNLWNPSDLRKLGDVDEMGIEILAAEDRTDYDEILDDPNHIHDQEESYYGWTRGFAVKMMERRRLADKERRGRRRDSYEGRRRDRSASRSHSRSRSRNHNRSRGARSRTRSRGSRSRSRSEASWDRRGTKHKRRARDRSYSRSHSRSRSRSRTRSRSRSRPRSRSRSWSRDHRKSRRRSYSPSRSRSRSRDNTRSRRSRSRSRSRSRGRSGSESRSPRRSRTPGRGQSSQPHGDLPPPPQPHSQQQQMPQPHMIPPPPPPPLPLQIPQLPPGQLPQFPTPQIQAQFMQAMAASSGWGALPFPPPPLPQMNPNFPQGMVPPPPPPQLPQQGSQQFGNFPQFPPPHSQYNNNQGGQGYGASQQQQWHPRGGRGGRKW